MSDKFEDDMLLRIKHEKGKPGFNLDEYGSGEVEGYTRALEAYRYYKDVGLI